MENLVARAEVKIKAPASEVWKALTDPEIIKQYLFGTQVETTWQVGSPITYKGEWEGKTYEDKGTILKVEEGKLLSSTYWSSISGIEDKPENYNTVTYELNEDDGETTLKLTQDNNKTEEDKNHSQTNWQTVLNGIKTLLEK